MSQNDMRRFAQDLRSCEALAAEVRRQADLETVVGTAQARGYRITVEDIVDFIYAKLGEAAPCDRPA